MKHAVVLGAGHPRAVATIRSLGRLGLPVVAIDREETANGFASRYVKERFCLEGEAETLDCLASLGNRGGGFLVPMGISELARPRSVPRRPTTLRRGAAFPLATTARPSALRIAESA